LKVIQKYKSNPPMAITYCPFSSRLFYLRIIQYILSRYFAYLHLKGLVLVPNWPKLWYDTTHNITSSLDLLLRTFPISISNITKPKHTRISYMYYVKEDLQVNPLLNLRAFTFWWILSEPSSAPPLKSLSNMRKVLLVHFWNS
jgi:hypothetical protein